MPPPEQERKSLQEAPEIESREDAHRKLCEELRDQLESPVQHLIQTLLSDKALQREECAEGALQVAEVVHYFMRNHPDFPWGLESFSAADVIEGVLVTSTPKEQEKCVNWEGIQLFIIHIVFVLQKQRAKMVEMLAKDGTNRAHLKQR